MSKSQQGEVYSILACARKNRHAARATLRRTATGAHLTRYSARRRSSLSCAADTASGAPVSGHEPELAWRNDLDGRGNLSEEALAEFTRFFLETCLDQVRFMESLVQPDRLRDRILIWAEEEVRAETLPQKAGQILEAVLYRGELPRGDVAALLYTSDRSARRVVSALMDRGVLVSQSTRAPLFLAFPAALASRWMPGLFPEKPA